MQDLCGQAFSILGQSMFLCIPLYSWLHFYHFNELSLKLVMFYFLNACSLYNPGQNISRQAVFPPPPISMLIFDEKWNMSCAIKCTQHCDRGRGFWSNFQSCLVIFGQGCIFSQVLHSNILYVENSPYLCQKMFLKQVLEINCTEINAALFVHRVWHNLLLEIVIWKWLHCH